MFRYFAGAFAVLLGVAGLTVVIVELTNLNEPDVEETAVDLPPAGEARVEGTLEAMFLGGAELDPLAMPLQVTTLQAGEGSGATISNVLVDGKTATIEWDAGRPLELSGDGALELTGSSVNIANNETSIVIDGLQSFTPGTYHIDTPVAVGTTGVAKARDAVTFEATTASSVVFRGLATVTRPAGAMHIGGRGAFSMLGELEAATSTGIVNASEVKLAAGGFDIRITPDQQKGLLVEASIDGTLDITRAEPTPSDDE